VDGPFTPARKVLIRVANARIAAARALPLFFPEKEFPAGIHPTAVIAASAQIDPGAHVGPFCHIGEKVQIAARAVLQGGNHIGDNCVIGAETNLFPRWFFIR